jgi:hypothetical protein
MNKTTERTINQSQYGLSFTQQDIIEANSDKLSVIELTRKAFDDSSLDERSSEYNGVRRFVAKLKRGIPTIEFTKEQLEFIHNNADVIGPYEMAKTLFPKKSVKPLSRETQTIKLYLDAIGATEDESDDKKAKYRPPKSSNVITRKINHADPNAKFDASDLSPLQKQCVDSLKSYLQSIRFLAFMNSIDDFDLRDMFEEEYIKATFDKPDLNSEELNMYVTLCYEYVNIQRLEREKSMLSKKINDTIEDSDDDKKGKLFYTWVDMYKEREEALHKAKTRAERLQTNLSSTRANRLKQQAQVNESLAKFVEEWKSEEGRKRALIIAEAKNLELEKEVDRIASMEEYIANIRGISKDELLNN